MQKKKILVIEDDESTLDTLVLYLEEQDFIVYSAKNGVSGLDIVKNHKPHLVISDIKMAGINGIELALLIKELNYRIPVILISAYDFADNKSVDICSYAFLQKPISIKDLNILIHILICYHRLSRCSIHMNIYYFFK